MSRHRIIKNLDLDEELDDGTFEEDYDISPEHQKQFDLLTPQVANIIGPASADEPEGVISEQEIQNALWDTYFDVERSVNRLLGERQKKIAAAKAKRKKEAAAQTPKKKPPPGSKAKGGAATPKSGAATPSGSGARTPTTRQAAGPSNLSQLRADIEGLNLVEPEIEEKEEKWVPPTVSVAKEKIIAEVKQKKAEGGKEEISLVVVGHVDAGKSTLMGRLLHDIGETTDRQYEGNLRASQKIGKGSFAYAWTFDQLQEERDRGVTIDVSLDAFDTPHRRFTLIDAPGHRDFIPNMISGASQADAALLVVDASKGAFEAGFGEGGQTREHALLVRSLGVQQVVVVVNKLDAVSWSKDRYDHICDTVKPFLAQSGFKLTFVPVAAMTGDNVVKREAPELTAWYEGPSMFDILDTLDVPARAIEAPFRMPVSNVFRGQSATASGLGVSGRIESGVVQPGDKLAVLPGDESGTVRAIEVDGETRPWATAGTNATLFLHGIDPIYVNIGYVLCPTNEPVPVVSTFTAQIVVFDIKVPLTLGAAVELFFHSRDIPATLSRLEATLDKAGAVVKTNPRMLTKGTSARVEIKIRSSTTGTSSGVPVEPFSISKAMGRVVIRKNGDTVAAGIVTAVGQ